MADVAQNNTQEPKQNQSARWWKIKIKSKDDITDVPQKEGTKLSSLTLSSTPRDIEGKPQIVKKGDCFYLCIGTDPNLLGKITEVKYPNKEKEQDTHKKLFPTIQFKIIKDEPVRKQFIKKWYSGILWFYTCKKRIYDVVLVPPEHRKDFENKILKKYFGVMLNTEDVKPSKPSGGNGSIEDHKEVSLNTILFGPPGTGKTYLLPIYAVYICAPDYFKDILIGNKDVKEIANLLDKEGYLALLEEFKQLKKEKRIQSVTFHQSYSYEEFIEGLKPILDNKTKTESKQKQAKNIEYDVQDGIFKKFCKEAEKISGPCVFIIDEINRGNISKIFGELITLAEDEKRKGADEATALVLPYSQEPFSIPDNVYILGTMNTADRSIALLDTALRRRFSFVEMMPNANVLKDEDGNDIKITVNHSLAGDVIEPKPINIRAMFEKINERIEYLYDREHTIGHAYFCGLTSSSSIADLADIFRNKIIPLLQEYFYDDYEKIRLVLGDVNTIHEIDETNKKEETAAHNYDFITAFTKKVSKTFFSVNGKGSFPDDIEAEKKVYKINPDAFFEPQSYIKIYDAKETGNG